MLHSKSIFSIATVLFLSQNINLYSLEFDQAEIQILNKTDMKTVSFNDETKKYHIKVELMRDFGSTKINEFIDSFIRQSFFPENNDSKLDLQKLFDIEGKKIADNLEKCEEYSCVSEYELNIGTTYKDETFIEVAFQEYSFNGGAHPNSYVQYMLFERETGKILKLNDIIADNSREKLRQIGEEEFKLDLNVSSFEEFWFEDGFKLNENFSISQNGLSFIYVPYEIAAYCYGTIIFTIPFEKITNLLIPNTTFSKWLDKKFIRYKSTSSK